MTSEPHVTEILRDGTHVLVRPISKDDVQLERDFIERLSPQSRRFRFLGSIKSPSEALLKQLTDIDESSEAAFIALVADSGHKREIGVARFSAEPDGSAEVAVTVDDHWQGKGTRHAAHEAADRGRTPARDRTAVFHRCRR